MRKRPLCSLACGLGLSAGVTAAATDDEPAVFLSNGNEIVVVGEIDSDAPARVRKALRRAPEARMLVLEWVGGSVDDDANLRLAAEVRAAGLTTLVPSGGLVSSGGADLFLAGRSRILEEGACIGVHAGQGGGIGATDLPRDDPGHERYLDDDTEMRIDLAFLRVHAAGSPSRRDALDDRPRREPVSPEHDARPRALGCRGL